MFPGVQRLVALSKQQQSLVAHDTVDTLVIDLVSIDTQSRPNTPVTIGGSLLHHISNGLSDLGVISLGRRLSAIDPVQCPVLLGHNVTARQTKRCAHSPHCSSPGNTGERAIHFFALAKSTASLRISFSKVLRPSAPSSCLMRLMAS